MNVDMTSGQTSSRGKEGLEGDDGSQGSRMMMGSGQSTLAVTISKKDGEEIIEVPHNKVGNIIGSKGAVIQDMQVRSGAKIFVNQDFPAGVNRQVVITGTYSQVKNASDLVKKVVEQGPTAIHANMLAGGPMVSTTMECPQQLVGRVIGSSGATIKDILARSGARIQINQDFPDGVPRQITISGTQTAVSNATSLITHVMDNGPMSLPPPASSMISHVLVFLKRSPHVS